MGGLTKLLHAYVEILAALAHSPLVWALVAAAVIGALTTRFDA